MKSMTVSGVFYDQFQGVRLSNNIHIKSKNVYSVSFRIASELLFLSVCDKMSYILMMHIMHAYCFPAFFFYWHSYDLC